MDMDYESIGRDAFLALLRRLEDERTDPLLIEIARALEFSRRGVDQPLASDRDQLLHEVRDQIVDVLGRILQEGKRNAFLRMEAAELLGQFETAATIAVPPLISALADEASFVRVTACQSLEQMGQAARLAADPLRGTAQDQDPAVRRAAAKALDAIEAG